MTEPDKRISWTPFVGFVFAYYIILSSIVIVSKNESIGVYKNIIDQYREMVVDVSKKCAR